MTDPYFMVYEIIPKNTWAVFHPKKKRKKNNQVFFIAHVWAWWQQLQGHSVWPITAVLVQPPITSHWIFQGNNLNRILISQLSSAFLLLYQVVSLRGFTRSSLEYILLVIQKKTMLNWFCCSGVVFSFANHQGTKVSKVGLMRQVTKLVDCRAWAKRFADRYTP